MEQGQDNGQEQEDNSIVCDLCKKSFKRRSALYYHIRRVHKLVVEFANRKNKFKCPDPSCSVTFHLANLLRNHIQSVHGVQIEMCVKNFNTYDEFKAWKDAEQDNTKSLYTSCQNIRCDKYRRYLYTCYRSGGYIPSKSSGRRKLTPKKIDGWCPAGMEVKAFNEGVVHVKYWMTHFGHECEVDCLNLTYSEKLMIAQKLQEGLSFEKILDDVRESVVDGDDIKRIHLLSRRDINNISKAFKISKKETTNKDEGPTINAWVQSMETLGKDSPVVFFKKKNSEHIMLKNYDYLLIIMTKVQQTLLENCSHNIVCLDDIRITQSYNFHLVTLMTIDDSDVACPLAYGIANKVDESVISLILEIINSKVGRITTNIFMSSDIPAFYSTWKKHMGPANTHLLCTWQVDKDWRRALEKLPCSKEKKGRIYKSLKQLMVETNFKEFRSRIEDTLKQLEADADLKPFSDTFKTKYVDRSELWASCYRSQQVLHYGAILEVVHKNLLECYEEGRVLNSFVKPLNSIFRFSRDKVIEKLQKLPEDFEIGDFGSIFKSSAEIQKLARTKIQDASEKLLLFPVVERDGCFVEYNTENTCPTNCVPQCNVCKICIHKFMCTCVENFVNLNVCSHVLSSLDMMQKQCGHVHETATEKNLEITVPDLEVEQCNNHVAIEKVIEHVIDNPTNISNEEESDIIMNNEEISHNEENCENFDVNMSEECAFIECQEELVSKEYDRGQNFEGSLNKTVEGECLEEYQSNVEYAGKDCVPENKSSKEKVVQELQANEFESYKSFLLDKVAFIHDMLNNRTFKPEEYKIFDEYLDKIIVVSNYNNQ